MTFQISSRMLTSITTAVRSKSLQERMNVLIFQLYCLTYPSIIKFGEIFRVFEVFKSCVLSFSREESRVLVTEAEELSENFITSFIGTGPNSFLSKFESERFLSQITHPGEISENGECSARTEMNAIAGNNSQYYNHNIEDCNSECEIELHDQFKEINVIFELSDTMKKHLIYLALGYLLSERLKFSSKGISYFTKAIQYYKSSFAYFSRGRVVDSSPKRISNYVKSIELDPLSLAYNNLALDLENSLRNYEGALNIYKKALTNHPYDPIIYNNRGILYENRLNNVEKALADYTTAIQMDKNYSVAWNNRGVCYRRLERYDLALFDYNQAISLDPTYECAIQNREYLYSIIRKFSSMGNM